MSDSILALLIAAIALCFSAVAARVPALASRILPDEGPRISGLDGLRGILAFAVFGHHCVAVRLLATSGVWQEPDGNIANLMGKLSVAMFFMVSAYLFLGKIFRSNGRLDLPIFAWGRVTRLTPVYVVAVALASLVVAVQSGFRLEQPLLDLLDGKAGWIGFGFFKLADVNGVENSSVMLSPTWSLRYEWFLYLLLPFAAFALRAGAPPWTICAGFFLLWLLNPWFAYFGLGGIVALVAARKVMPQGWWGLPVAALALAALLAFFHEAHVPGAMALAFIVFGIVMTNARVAALFDRAGLLFAGQISYGVYLLHLPILFGLATCVFSLEQIGWWSDLEYVAFCAGAGAVMVAVTIAVHLAIEKPGMDLAKLFAKRPAKTELQPSAAP